MIATSLQTFVRVISIAELVSVIEALLLQTSVIALDCETTGLSPWKDKVVTVQFGTLTEQYVLDTRPFYTCTEADKQQWYDGLQLLAKSFTIVGHNIKFDWNMLKVHFNVHMDRVIDTMIQELVLYGLGQEGAKKKGMPVNMEDTATRYGLKVSKTLQKWSVGLDLKEEWYKPFPQSFLLYCAQDITVPLTLNDLQRPLLARQGLIPTVTLENACLPAIAKMECDGCLIDTVKWRNIIQQKETTARQQETELYDTLTPHIHRHRHMVHEAEVQAFDAWQAAYDAELARLEQEYKEHAMRGDMPGKWGKYKVAGLQAFRLVYPRPKTPAKVVDLSPINMQSHVQLKTALACIGVVVEGTGEEYLEPFMQTVPLVRKLIVWKKLTKFIGSFGENFLAKIDADGRAHPNYKPVGAETGRIQCAEPAWQTIPSHEPPETDVRRAVVAQLGYRLLTADLPNIEARIAAELSGDIALLAFFKAGGDLHSYTARLMFKLPDSVDPEKAFFKTGITYRKAAKAINFGLMYGMSPFKLSNDLGIPLDEAEDLFTKYFTAFPQLGEYLERASKQALETGYSATVNGRKRFYKVQEMPRWDKATQTYEEYKEIRKKAYMLNSAYGRQAKNAPIQGTNADIIKYVLALLYKHLPSYVKLVACVHDEIVLEVPEEKAVAVSKLLSTAMQKACTHFLHVVHIPPIKVSMDTYWTKD